MKLPPNMTEHQVVTTMQKVVNVLAPSFKFGYYDVEDIKQQGMLFAVQAMEDYDPTRPLENFLHSHVKNRLINLRRDKYKRNDPPCLICHKATASQTTPEHPDGQLCTKYISWRKRNISKKNIIEPVDISLVAHALPHESKAVYDVEVQELVQIIDEKLPVDLRASLKQMQAGVRIPKARRKEVERAVKRILGEDSECQQNTNAED